VECGAVYAESADRYVCSNCRRYQTPGGPTRGVLEVVIETLPSRWPAASARPPRAGSTAAARGDRVAAASSEAAAIAPLAAPEFLAEIWPVASPRSLPPFPVGGTPLLPVPELRRALDMPNLWVKDDTRNPTGSTKDRASLLVVAKAGEYGLTTIAAASTGNAATSLAGVAAAAGVRAVVFVPASAPEAKLTQMMSLGATVLAVRGTYDDAFELSLRACESFGWYNRNTAFNPFTIEGKKTVAFEIGAAMTPDAPDAVVVPVGDGVILGGVAKGFRDLVRAGLLPRAPRLIAVQPEGSGAIARALAGGADEITPEPNATSIADSLVVAAPRNAISCLRSIRESRGTAVLVTDGAIAEAIGELARRTGVFAEPAGAAAYAGLLEARDNGSIKRDERVILLVTGTGLKDLGAARRRLPPIEAIPADLDAVTAAIRKTEGRV
jgi:threonine synthase